MNIRSVTAQPLAAEFASLFGGQEKVPASLSLPGSTFATFPRTGQYSTIVTIETEDGQRGVGECWGLPLPEVATALIGKVFGRMIVGREADDVEARWKEMFTLADRLGHTRGYMLEAISGIDIALWDLNARRQRKSVGDLMGGHAIKTVPCYASPVPLCKTVEEAERKAMEFVAEGFLGLKVKVGMNLDHDKKIVRAVRRAVDPKIKVMVDANCGYDVPDAIAFAKAVEDLDIYWLEELISPEDVDGMRAIRKNTTMRLALGENEFTAAGVAKFVRAGVADVVMPNVIRCGGITGVRKINEVLRQHGVRLSLHGVGAGIGLATAVHVMSTAPNPDLYEYNRLLNPLRDDLLVQNVGFRDGGMVVPSGPGLGVTVLPEKAKRFLAGEACTVHAEKNT